MFARDPADDELRSGRRAMSFALADVLPNARRRTLDGQTHQFAPEALAPALHQHFGQP